MLSLESLEFVLMTFLITVTRSLTESGMGRFILAVLQEIQSIMADKSGGQELVVAAASLSHGTDQEVGRN